jgi:hypothetical protein
MIDKHHRPTDRWRKQTGKTAVLHFFEKYFQPFSSLSQTNLLRLTTTDHYSLPLLVSRKEPLISGAHDSSDNQQLSSHRFFYRMPCFYRVCIVEQQQSLGIIIFKYMPHRSTAFC